MNKESKNFKIKISPKERKQGREQGGEFMRGGLRNALAESIKVFFK
jgi:hypothetical protein